MSGSDADATIECVPLTQTCLCFLIDDPGDRPARVLLGRKRRGLGRGKIVGLGGHVEPGEDGPAAAIRETAEESGCVVEAAALRPAANLSFRFPDKPEWEQDVEVFIASRWQGDPVSTEEIIPAWHALDALPFDEMWDDNRYWLARVLAGERLTVHVVFGPDNQTVLSSDVRPQ